MVAAIATGMSNSRVGVVRVGGEQAFSMIDSIFRDGKGKKVRLSLSQFHTTHYGYIHNDDEKMDGALVIIMKGLHGCTAEDMVEIDYHGGVPMIRRILGTVLRVGARTVEPGESIRRTFLNGRLDLSQAEAAVDMIHATNEYALKSSVSQLGGPVFAKIEELRSRILCQIAFIESVLDDPEHISLDGYGSRLVDDLVPMTGEMRKLPLSTDDGRVMPEEVETVILGKPNAGKSSLMNVLLGEGGAIVTEVAGTTRDALEEHTYLQGINLNVVDTVGIGDTEDVVEKIGMDRVMKAARDADLIIYVMDGSRPLDESDREIIEFIRDRKATVLLNESDLDLEVGTTRLEQTCGHKVSPVSAKGEQGIKLLEQEIKKPFYHGDLSLNDQVYITDAYHKGVLGQCLESLLMVKGNVEDSMPEDFYSIDLMNVYEQPGFIIGEVVDDDVVNEVFAKSHMGKQGNLVWKRSAE